MSKSIKEDNLFFKVSNDLIWMEIFHAWFGGGHRANYYSKTKANCESNLIFTKEFVDENTFFFLTFKVSLSVLQHKHPHNPHFIEAHRNYLSTEQIKEIIYQEKAGVLSDGILANINPDDMHTNII